MKLYIHTTFMCMSVCKYICLYVCVCVCVCAAANVNDRSMTGERDSEVAVRYEDKDMVRVKSLQ